jgi:hypothetical protein
MTSLLSFAWKCQGIERASSRSPEVPEVSASSSGETLTIQPSEDSTFTAAASAISPDTPEGLRPRQSADAIRQSLPPHVLRRLEWQPHTTQNVHSSWRPLSSCLPPPDCRVVNSPNVSTSSFYSRSSDPSRQIAVSPSLKVGKARTAVGALLAMSESNVSFHETTKTGVPTSSKTTNCHMNVLPPRTWRDENEQEDADSNYNTDLQYQSLNDSHMTPNRMRIALVENSPTSTAGESSIHASPSSNKWRRSYLEWKQAENRNQQEESSLGRGWLMEEAPIIESYDFDSIVNRDLFVPHPSESATNVSAISHSVKDNESLQSLQSLRSLVEEEEEGEEHSYYRHYTKIEDDDMGETNQRQNTKNQREKEDLLLATIERLQDDVKLVNDVMKSAGKGGIVASLEKENIFTGFSKEKRAIVCRAIDSILNEMNAPAPKEFGLAPSQIPKIAETHDNYRNALLFCRALVGTAVPPAEKQVHS